LGQENDMLGAQNKYLDKEIARYEEMQALSKAAKKTRVQEMREHSRALKKNISSSLQQMADAREEFLDIQDMVAAMVHKFKVAQFVPRIATGMVYDDQTQFNEGNIKTYLSELEELITKLIT